MKLTDKPRVYIRTDQGELSIHPFSDNESAALWAENCANLPGVKAVLRKAGDERPVEQADWEGVRQ